MSYKIYHLKDLFDLRVVDEGFPGKKFALWPTLSHEAKPLRQEELVGRRDDYIAVLEDNSGAILDRDWVPLDKNWIPSHEGDLEKLQDFVLHYEENFKAKPR